MTTLAEVDLCGLDPFADGPPYDLFARLRAEAPVCFLPEPGGPGFWGVFRYDDVVTVSRHPHQYGSHPNTMIHDPDDGGGAGAGALMLNQDPPHHTKLRKLVNRGFTPRQVSLLEPRVRAIVDRLLTDAAARGQFDLVSDVAVELPLQVIAELVGVPDEDRHTVFAWTERSMGLDESGHAASEAEARAAIAEMFAYADRLIAARAGGAGDDLLSVLLAAEVDGERLSPADVDLFFLLLMNAGSETTRNLVTGGTLALFEHPDEAARLRADPALLPGAVEEMLRFVTPVVHFRRTAREDLDARRTGHPRRRQGRHLVLVGEPGRGPVPRRRPLRRDPHPERARRVRRWRPPFLPRCRTGPPRGPGALRGAPRALPDPPPSRPGPAGAVELHQRDQVAAGGAS